MEKAKKDLRVYSLLILIVTAISLVKIIVDVITNGLPQATEIPEGMTKEMAQMAVTIAFVISLIMFIPQVYVGFKGMSIAKGESVKKALDYKEVGGSVILGISKPVIKAHGSSDARAIRSAVRQAIQAVESGYCEDIRENIEAMSLPRGN